MSGRRTLPFPGFSRGVPIIGQQQPPEPAKGLYFYQLPVLIARPGAPLDADTFEIKLSMPMTGVHIKQLTAEITEQVAAKTPDEPKPKVILLQPIMLGFVPEDAVEAAGKASGKPAGDPS